MLSTGARVFGKTHLHVFFVDGVGCFLGGVAHDHRHGGSVHAAFALGGWHALPTVPAAFAVQALECVFVFRPNFGEKSAGLRAENVPRPPLGQGIFFVELRLDADQRFGIVAAFGSANFDMTGWGYKLCFHDV